MAFGLKERALSLPLVASFERAATAANLGIKAHAHTLRHACGYKLANDGHDTRAIQAYLGHRNIQNTTRYTVLAPQRFREFFKD
jgi:site-specific recombinase XerD